MVSHSKLQQHSISSEPDFPGTKFRGNICFDLYEHDSNPRNGQHSHSLYESSFIDYLGSSSYLLDKRPRLDMNYGFCGGI